MRNKAATVDSVQYNGAFCSDIRSTLDCAQCNQPNLDGDGAILDLWLEGIQRSPCKPSA